MVATILSESVTTTSSSTSSASTPTKSTLISSKTIINLNNKSSPSTLLTTITNTTENKMSCSIEEASNGTQLDKQNQVTASASNTSTSSSSTPSSSSTSSSSSSSSSSSNSTNSSNLISLVTPIQLQTQNGSFQSNQQSKPNGTLALNLNCVNNPNQTQQTNGQIPTKLVQASNQFIITTLFQGGSAPKVVTLSAPNSLNQTQNMASSSSVCSSSTSSVSAGSNTSSNGSSSSPSLNQQQQQQQNEPTTTTITLTSPNPNQQNQGPTILFPLQTHNQSQYANFVDTNQTQTQTVSLFSPLGATGSNQQYYTFQTTPNFVQQQSILTTQGSNQQNVQQSQQSQQQQQVTYSMFNDPPPSQNSNTSQQQIEMENIPIEFEGHPTHTTQAAPITVQWLIDNFEPAEGCSLRRSTLYNYYTHHCREQKIEHVNPASFGKLIRSVFLGLRTRRLGTRGNSKYHYYGIRVKINSPLNNLSDDQTYAIHNHPMSLSPTGSPQSHQPKSPLVHHNHSNGPTPNKRSKTSNFNNYEHTNEYKPIITQVANNESVMTVVLNGQSHKTIPQTTQIAKNNNKNDMNNNTIQKLTENNTNLQQQQQQQQQIHNQVQQYQQQQQQQHQEMGLLKTTQSNEDLNQQISLTESNQIPNFGHVNLDNIELPSNCTLNDVKKFEELYKLHCEKILDCVIGLKLDEIKNIWFTFWRSLSVNSLTNSFYEDQLPNSKFFALCELSPIIDFVKQCDYLFYQFCIEILIPDVLGSLPPSLVQNIRSLSKSVDIWLKQALLNVPDRMKQSKLVIINTFSMTLRRYTSLNHLAQTVKNSLQNEQILAQMLSDINRVDFNYIREQAKWTCGCDEISITKLENEFKDSLRNHTQWSLEGWIGWLDTTASAVLREFEGTDKFSKMAKQFLLKWSFMCSSIVRDLTLRSAPTFGSFHLIRLLYDEYMSYWIEHKIANEFKKTPLEIMSTFDIV